MLAICIFGLLVIAGAPIRSRPTIHQVVDRLWSRHGVLPASHAISHESSRKSLKGAIREIFDEAPENFKLSFNEMLALLQGRLASHKLSNTDSIRRQIGKVRQERYRSGQATYRPRAMDLARDLLMSGRNRCLSNIRLGDLLAEKFVESGRIVPNVLSLQDHITRARRELSDETGHDWSFASCSKEMMKLV